MDFTDELQTLLFHALELIRTPLFWTQVGVLILAASGALMTHWERPVNLLA